MARYRVSTWHYQENSVMNVIREGEVSRITVEDTFNKNQIVAEFPVKVSKKAGMNPEYYGVFINNATLAETMACRLCRQMNRESGYERE